MARAPHEGVRLLPALREPWPQILGYYVSLAFIGSLWIIHAGVTRFIKRGDPAACALNLLLLLIITLVGLRRHRRRRTAE